MADNNNPFGDARSAQQFGREFGKYLYDATVSYFNGGSFQGTRNNMASQSAMSDRARSNGWQMGNNNNTPRFGSRKNPLDQIEDAFAKEMLNAISGGDFKKNINKALTTFSQQMGFEFNELPTKLGQELGKQFAQSGVGKALTKQVQNLLVGEHGDTGLIGSIGKRIGPETAKLFKNMAKDMVNLPGTAEGVAELGTASVEGATALGEMAGAVGAVLPEIALAVAAIALVAKIAEPAIEGFGKMLNALTKSAFKEDELRAKRRDAAQKRLEADINYLVEHPFELLNEAAQKWYDTWDNNLQTVGQTQGYNKESVYNLYSSYAERLRSEGLDAVVSSTSVIDGLKQVLATGLSGKAAEEFAYTATKLQAAIPTMNFFQYAGSYAQIASNAIAQGASQAEAINLANEQLEAFANNVLYANRELAGGFNTGLSNASQLFTDAVKIAQTARTGDTTAISGVLTSVSAVVGAVAPDLASGLVDNIVKAAIGGNSESIVALRSLAGINASNTEFLRAFAEDPQSVFSSLFNKLAELQTMSNDNFMEVAEGLAPIFGVDMAALAQVDFNYLARAIEQMDINSGSLEENIALLASGETTTTAEQAKMAEINQMILDEGLGIVIDNEAARMVQQHMWDEQRDAAMQSATYAVDLQGAALSLLQGIAQTVTIMERFMHPLSALDEAIDNISETLDDAMTERQALNEILVKGAVKGSNAALNNLINYSGMSPLDVFNEGITNSNYNTLRDTRLSRMLFGGTDVSGSTYYQNSNSNTPWEAYASPVSAAITALNSDTADTLAAINRISMEFGNAVWEGGFTTLNIAESLINGNGGTANEIGSAIGQSINDELIDAMYFDRFDKSNHSSISSQYGWGTVGKSSARFLSINSNQSALYADTVGALLGDETEANKSKLRALLATVNDINQAAIDLDAKDTTGKLATKIKDVVTKTGTTTYEDWVATQFGDKDTYLEAIEAYGTTEEAVKNQFEFGKARSAAAVEEARSDAAFAFNQDARNVIDEMRKFWDFAGGTAGIYETVIWNPFVTAWSTFWGTNIGDYNTQFWQPFFADGAKFDQGIITLFNEMVNIRDSWIGDTTKSTTVRGLLNTINSTLISFNNSFDDWVQDWTDFYINHTTYSARTSSADWSEMVNMEASASRDTALALANSLEALSNLEDLKDPTVQSNVLLAKIVVLLEAIMQQNNGTGGLSLIDTISAMSLGLTNRTS